MDPWFFDWTPEHDGIPIAVDMVKHHTPTQSESSSSITSASRQGMKFAPTHDIAHTNSLHSPKVGGSFAILPASIGYNLSFAWKNIT